jgi:hypothetical protein
LTFDGLDINYDVTAGDDLSFHTLIDITGTATGTIVIGQGNSTFTWNQGFESSGMIHTDTTITSLGVDVPLDFPLGQQYNSQTNVDYQCSGNSLKMAGYIDGKFIWAYTWNRAN